MWYGYVEDAPDEADADLVRELMSLAFFAPGNQKNASPLSHPVQFNTAEKLLEASMKYNVRAANV